MSTQIKKLMLGAGAADDAPGTIADLFSSYVYIGDSAQRNIINGVDLSVKGLAWIKCRDQDPSSNQLYDTERGVGNALVSNTDAAELYGANGLTAFNLNGFAVNDYNAVNYATWEYISWSFRAYPRFFDIVKYTGNGTAGTEISHNLGALPGMVIIKKVSVVSDWIVYHRGMGTTYAALLNTNSVKYASTEWDSTAPTTTAFTLGSDATVNDSGVEYIAYFFAHETSDDPTVEVSNVVQCGSFTGTGTAPHIELGWEPQYIMVKASAYNAGGWYILDMIRGIATDLDDPVLKTDTADDGYTVEEWALVTPTGFKPKQWKVNNVEYIYMAIRRPMVTPESAAEVFDISERDGTTIPQFPCEFPADMAFYREPSSVFSNISCARLLQASNLKLNGTDAEATNTGAYFDYMDGWYSSNIGVTGVLSWMWKRAFSFFDVVTYDGDGIGGREIPHNLGVAPEMMWVKSRSAATGWPVYHSGIGEIEYLLLDTDDIPVDDTYWDDTAPTDSVFTVGSTAILNGLAGTYIAYLFASLDGISKVGSYTGDGSTQTINCNFSTGASFILIKRTDVAGDWFMWDSSRGITSGSDPHISLNTSVAQVSDGSVGPASIGFTVTQVATVDINVLASEYVFYAIAAV